MLPHQSGVISGFKQVGLVVTLVTGIILTSCAAPAQAPAASPGTGALPVDQPVPADAESDNRPLEYVVVNQLSTADATLLDSAYILAPPSESLNQVLKELGRTNSGNIGVMTPYDIGLELGLNGPIVVQATDTEMPDVIGELTFSDPLFTEFEDKSFLYEFDANKAFTDTTQVNVGLNIFGAFDYTDTVPNLGLGTLSAYTSTISANWDDYCKDHPVECGGAREDPQGLCKCGYWWFDPLTFRLVWIPCNSCN
jgi:hypothetical protein